MRDQTLESCAWDRVARGEEIGWLNASGSGVDKSQCRIEPSEPPETRIG